VFSNSLRNCHMCDMIGVLFRRLAAISDPQSG
jgi:hypothetical protein